MCGSLTTASVSGHVSPESQFRYFQRDGQDARIWLSPYMRGSIHHIRCCSQVKGLSTETNSTLSLPDWHPVTWPQAINPIGNVTMCQWQVSHFPHISSWSLGTWAGLCLQRCGGGCHSNPWGSEEHWGASLPVFMPKVADPCSRATYWDNSIHRTCFSRAQYNAENRCIVFQYGVAQPLNVFLLLVLLFLLLLPPYETVMWMGHRNVEDLSPEEMFRIKQRESECNNSHLQYITNSKSGNILHTVDSTRLRVSIETTSGPLFLSGLTMFFIPAD